MSLFQGRAFRSGLKATVCATALVGCYWGTQAFAEDGEPAKEEKSTEEERGSTLLGRTKATGGIGGLVIKRITVDDSPVFLFGGTGGGIFNRSLELGGSVFSTLGNHWEYGDARYKISLLYTEFRMGIHLFAGSIIYPRLNFDFGIGHIGLQDPEISQEKQRSSDFRNFFVTDPGATLIVNISDRMQLGFGASYMNVYGMDHVEGFNPKSLEGVTYSGQVTFGFL